MAVQTIIPDSDVLLTDIKDTLNANGSSCTNEVLSFFDSRAEINHWSFRKPYATDDDTYMLTDSQIRSLNCGFTITGAQMASYTNLPSKINGGMNGWVYNRPTGGATSPYRAGDYVGYLPGAHPIISGMHVPSTVSNQFSNIISVTALVAQQGDGSVSLADIGSLDEAYAGVYIKQASGSLSHFFTGENEIGDSGTFDVPFDVSKLQSTGTWYLYPCLKLGSVYYAIPGTDEMTLNVVASYFTIGVRATRRLGGTKAIDYTITVNNRSSAVTWTNNTWRLRFNGKEFSDSLVSGEMSGNLTSPQTIAGNTTTTITGSITNVNATLWAEPTIVLWVSFNSGNHVQSGVIVENVQT